MPVENKDSRAHAFIESIFGYYLHASVYSPYEKRDNKSCFIAHCFNSLLELLNMVFYNGDVQFLRYNAGSFFLYSSGWILER